MNGDNGGRTIPFLIEIRGVLQVDADSGDAAERQIEAWIIAVGRGGTAVLPAGARFNWLRIDPESDERPGWRPSRGRAVTD